MACSTQTQFRRGTTAQNAAFTGVVGEVTFDTQVFRLITHDGITPGGFKLALLSDTVAGADFQIQFNDNGVLGVDAGFTYNTGAQEFSVAGASFFAGASTTINNSGVATVFLDAGTANFAAGATMIAADGSATFAGGGFTIGSDAALNIQGVIRLDGSGAANFAAGGGSGGQFTVQIDAAGNISIGTDIANAASTFLGVDGGANFANGNLTLESPSGNITTSGSITAGGTKFTAASSGVVTKYNSENTAGPGIVSIVGSYDGTAQTNANIASTNLYTNNTGVSVLLEVSLLQVITSAATSGTLTTTLSWTDEAGATTSTGPGALNIGALGRNSSAVIINLPTGNTLSFASVLGARVGNVTYKVKISVKREI